MSMENMFPLNEAQKGVYFECVNEPDSLKYNIPVYFKLPVGTDRQKFINAVKTVYEHRKIFGVCISAPDGVPSMVQKRMEFKITEKRVSDAEAECKSMLHPFDLENGPLCEFFYLDTPECPVFLMHVHHIIFDGTTVNRFIHDVAQAYDTGVCRDEELTIFDVSDTKSADAETKEKYRAFFKEKFEGADCDSTPISDRISDNGDAGSDVLRIMTDGYFTADDACTFAKECNVTENALFLGAFAYTLAKVNGTENSYFTTVHNGRLDSRLADTYGMFVRTIPMYCNIDEKSTVSNFLSVFHNDYYLLKKNDCVPFGELVSEYGIGIGTTFVFQSSLFDNTTISDGEIEMTLPNTGETVSDIELVLIRCGGAYKIKLGYKKSLYTEAFIRRFADTFMTVVRGMMTAKTLGEIPLVDSSSKAVLDRFNDTAVEYNTDTTVVELFREQAKRTPDSTCLIYCDKKFTYREVDEITDALASYLIKNGVGREKVAGVLIPRCEYMLICSLGILKAGGAYLPLDPTYPPERLNFMMQDSGAVMLLYDKSLSDVITSEFSGPRMATDEIPHLDSCDIQLPTPDPHDLFVMLYTSGSTGTPKGVMFEHSNTLVTTEFVKRYFSVDGSSKVTAYASYGFDAHAFDMYPAVTSGAELHIISDEIRLDFPLLREYFNKNGITHSVMTTQVGRQFSTLGGLKTLRHLSVAGEKLTPPEIPEGFALYNLYGPTEGSIITSAFKLTEHYKDVPIGKPVDNLKMYVVDKSGRLLPPCSVGELWIAGPHVTRGYLNRPDKTEEAYGLNPFDSEKGYERVYRTGDIVRILSDGNLQFVGRRDAQVKVRGFRIELTEIEEVIRRFDGISDATVAAFDDEGGGKFVAAYVVSESKIDTDALADFIRSEKPPYMVPAVIMQIDKIPLTQNHKVNRRALPVPERTFGEIVAPTTETQKKLCKIIAEVIGHENFGITTDIYEAGLTSIGAVKLNVQLAEAFDTPIRIADIKTNETVEKLEKFLGAAEKEETHDILDDYPITETQSGIFVECMASPEATAYNIPVLIKLGDTVDTSRLVSAVTSVINAHPYTKTVLFTDKNGDVRAKRNDSEKVNVQVIKCDSLPSLSKLIRPYKILGTPLYRIEIYETNYGKYIFMDFHHIICDGTSEAILFEDISRAYGGEEITSEKYSGFEAALDEQAARKSNRYNEAAEYWKTVLSGADTSSLPKKDPESTEVGAGLIKHGTTDASKILAYCTKHGVTANAFFNGVFSFVLSRFANKESLTYTTVYNGRSDSRLNRSVTMLVKTLPMVANFSDNTKTEDLIREMQTQLIGGMSNDIYSFAEISRAYSVKADIIFVYQGEEFVFDTLCGEKAEFITIPSSDAKAPISVNVYLKDGKFEYTVEYRKDIYCEDFARSLAEAISVAAENFSDSEFVREVSMMSQFGEDMYKVLNASDTAIEDAFCHEMFEKYAEIQPDKTAVTAAGESITYGELNRQANIMARNLIKLGVGRDKIIGLLLDRTKEVLITELAILKAGGAFLPMIPTYPDERIEYCLTNAESPYVITSQSVLDSKKTLFASDKPYKALTTAELLKGDNGKNPETKISPEDLAYCIYTSGSTGTPKGVMIEHRNFSNFVQTNRLFENYYKNDSNDGAALASSSISFDMSLFELFIPLCFGKSLYMCTEEEFHNPADLIKLIETNNVQMMVCTPSFMNNMVSMPNVENAIRTLKSIVVGAEAFPSALYDTLHRISPELQIINGYGPTETSVCCSYKELRSGSGITIGRPTGNVKMYVSDRFGNVLPPYAIGELIICGLGVGRGYVKLPDKTKASFFTLRSLPAYHSGDLVRLNKDSEIEFGGRIDNQVKLRGFRVELDEIEKVMCTFGPVKQSKVLVRNNGTEDYLAGFFTADKCVDIDELTEHIKSRLTYYMVPAVMMQLEKMPLTPNGKIDKNGFPEVQKQTSRKSGRRAPKKSLEQKLCEIFANVLSLDEVYADDNFFELGGTSLSASKVTMLLMSESIEVKYGDIFDNPTPEQLASFIEERDGVKKAADSTATKTENVQREALKWNTVRYAHEVRRDDLGNVLLTGAVGFLGIHVLYELLKSETGHIYCLVRRGSHETAEIRLKTMLVYYFSNGFEKELKERITIIDADITDASLAKVLKDVPFDTVINCAACVKHFSDNDILDRINVGGVENLINICKEKDARLVQISTVSVPGIHTEESYEKQIRMHENELFVIDDMSNKYAISKYTAELRILDAIENGLRAKIIRVGNLMGRHSDGEFQANMETNMFLSGIRGFAVMGKYPISHMTDPMSFSPVDCTAKAVVLLAGTNDKFTAFNANNRYGFDEMKIIDACNRNGISIYPAADDAYYTEFRKKLGDGGVNSNLTGLAAYDIKDAHAVETDNLFTTNILYRIGFSWPLVDDAYLDRAIHSIMTLDYFNVEENDGE